MEDPFTGEEPLSSLWHSQSSPPLQIEDYRVYLKVLMIASWINLAVAVCIRLLYSGSSIWPGNPELTTLYDLSCVGFLLTNIPITFILRNRRWLNRYPRKRLGRFGGLLAFVLARDAFFLLLILMVSSPTQTPLAMSVPIVLVGAWLLFPGNGGRTYSIFFLVPYAALIALEMEGRLPLGQPFQALLNLNGPVFLPGLAVLVVNISAVILLGIAARRRLDSLGALLHRPPMRDPATTFYDAAYLSRRLEEELERARIESDPVTLLYGEVSNLWNIKERFGDAQGEHALVELGQVVWRTIRREEDVAVRLSGSLFAILLVGASSEESHRVAERLVENVGLINAGDGEGEGLELRIGFATTTMAATAHGPAMVEAARHALSRAQQGGAGRIEYSLLKDLNREQAL